MASVGNAALAIAITNHMPSVTPTFSPITSRDDTSDAATARRKKKEKLRNILIITLNPLTIILVLLIVYWSVRAVNRHLRYVRLKRKSEREGRQKHKEMERQWRAAAIYPTHASSGCGSGSDSTSEKTLGSQTPVPIIGVVDTCMKPHRGFFSRWRRSRHTPATTYAPGYVSIVPKISTPTTTTTTPLITSERTDTHDRTSTDTDRTALAVDVAAAKKAEDSNSLESGSDTSSMTAADEKMDGKKDMDN